MIPTSTEVIFGFCVSMHDQYLQMWIEKKKKKSHKGSSIITSLCAILALQLWQSGKQTQMSEVHKHGVQGNFHNQNHEQAVTAIKTKWQCQYLHSYLGS